MKQTAKVPLMLAGLAILLWSTVASAFKLALQHFTPFQLVFLASICSAMVLGVLAIIFKRKTQFLISWKIKDIMNSLMLGLLNPFMYYLILFEAYKRLPAQIAQPVNFTWPIFLTILAVIFFNEKVSVRTFPALLISFTGVVVLSVQATNSFNLTGKQFVVGMLLGLLSALIWAVYWIISLKDKRPALIRLFTGFSWAVLFLSLYGWISGSFSAEWHSEYFIYPVYIGFFEMSITFFLWVKALEKAPNKAFLSNLLYLIPVLSLFFITIVLKEPIQTSTFLGLLLIIAGVYIQSFKKKNKPG